MAYIRPIKLVNPFLEFTSKGTTPVTVNLTCYARGVHLVPEEDDASATFCDPLGFTWTLTVDLLQSLGAEGLDALLWSLGGPGTLIDVTFAYTDPGATAPTEDNPTWTVETRLAAWAIVDAGINEPTEINMEMTVIGEPVREPAPTVPVVEMASA